MRVIHRDVPKAAGRLLLIDKQGRQQTILSFLKAPQSIVPTGRGTYLLAEGGRDRVLELVPDTLTPKPAAP